jgi:hypothetical protein
VVVAGPRLARGWIEPIDPALRAAEYRKEGWATFDPNAPPYRPSQTEIDRNRRVS